MKRKEQARMNCTSALSNRLGNWKTMIQIQTARKLTGSKPERQKGLYLEALDIENEKAT